MADWVGRFDSKGTPTLGISIVGISAEPKQFDAIIDTGFTGFLLVPLQGMSIRRSQITGLMEIALADGITYKRLYVPATVIVDGESRTEAAILEPDGHEVIIGMDFLRRFWRGLTLLPSEGKVLLPRDSSI